MAIDKCDNMWVMKTLKDIDFRGKVILQFLVELRQVHRLDGNESPRFLGIRAISIRTGLQQSIRSGYGSPYEHPGTLSRSFPFRSHHLVCIDRWTFRGEGSRVTSEYDELP